MEIAMHLIITLAIGIPLWTYARVDSSLVSEMEHGYTLKVSDLKSTHDKADGHCRNKFNGNLFKIESQKDLELLRTTLQRIDNHRSFLLYIKIRTEKLSRSLSDNTKSSVTVGQERQTFCTAFNLTRTQFNLTVVKCNEKLQFVCKIISHKRLKHNRKRDASYSFFFANKNILNMFQPSPFDVNACRPATKNNYENSLASRVVGGEVTLYGSQPWQVEIAQIKHGKPQHHCSGVIISEFYVLSTAHCFSRNHEKFLQSLRVITGDHNIEMKDQHEAEYEIERVTIHPKHLASLYANDIAIIKIKAKMTRGIVFGTHVKPVCMPDHNTIHDPGTNCIVSGWGLTEDSLLANVSTILKAADVKLLSTALCRNLYKNYNPVNEGMLCAGHLQGGIDSCHGDSGGPLVCNVSDTMYLFGLVSWGDGCALPNRPGVYVRVQHYLKWIKDKIEEMS